MWASKGGPDRAPVRYATRAARCKGAEVGSCGHANIATPHIYTQMVAQGGARARQTGERDPAAGAECRRA